MAMTTPRIPFMGAFCAMLFIFMIPSCIYGDTALTELIIISPLKQSGEFTFINYRYGEMRVYSSETYELIENKDSIFLKLSRELIDSEINSSRSSVTMGNTTDVTIKMNHKKIVVDGKILTPKDAMMELARIKERNGRFENNLPSGNNSAYENIEALYYINIVNPSVASIQSHLPEIERLRLTNIFERLLSPEKTKQLLTPSTNTNLSFESRDMTSLPQYVNEFVKKNLSLKNDRILLLIDYGSLGKSSVNEIEKQFENIGFTKRISRTLDPVNGR